MPKLIRRDFISSIVAAMSVAAIGRSAIPSNDIHWDLFSGDYSGYPYDVTAPWVHGDKKIATDVKILVSMPHSGEVAAGGRKVPDAGRLWWDAFDSSGWSPDTALRQSKIAVDSLCAHCAGTGRVGHGRHRIEITDVDDNHFYRWSLATVKSMASNLRVDVGGERFYRWVGGKACPDCEMGRAPQPLIGHEGTMFCPGYLARLRTLGAFDFKILTDVEGEHLNCAVMLVRFGNGGKAFLMSMTPPPLCYVSGGDFGSVSQ